ncbi:dicer-like protein 2 [Podospora australis]|uniref:Dicer-like protein 2 n=1 Tax=Podospora australis TaxID=1536484 RepID=A0AAN7AGT6_9PEZI|nr:dicer-like protein 2 [Podospora australis]
MELEEVPLPEQEDTVQLPAPEQTTSEDSDDSGRSLTPRVMIMAARAYQREMLEESLKQNIIVAMDTGSGKTQVAILRIQEELERSDKIVWFLAPTVELATQQFQVINSQIPGVQSKLICGADNVEAWKFKPGVWDAILTNIRVVVSTYQILFDAAVSHGFVPIEKLGLVVIDEAHNCVRLNPIARFMRELYQKHKLEGRHVPHILGLTASPLMRSKLADLELLEQTLDAVCKTPNRHREELLAQVNRPEMIAIPYGGLPGPKDDVKTTLAMSRLREAFYGLDIRQDPAVLRLKSDRTERSQEALRKAILTYDTYCQKQMRAFCNRAGEMCQVLGPWAADYYIHKVITEFISGANTSTVSGDASMDEERLYLAKTFLQIGSLPPSEEPTELSRKVRTLISILESCNQKDPYGIIFVKERATVAVLSRILSTHASIRERYRVGSMVGTSKAPGKKQTILDLGQKEDVLSLQNFRKGKFNLLVATSVLEEGIDVPVCNMVICFDKPDNLKSFIQRRGRARMSVSRLYLLVENMWDQSLQEWQLLEKEMKEKYEDEMREIKQLEGMESSEIDNYPILRDNRTGAQLTIHDAKQHLDHFCATLSTRKFVNWSPYYKVCDLQGNPIDSHQPGLRKATVHLPISLAPQLRSAESLHAWPSEANACRDAAFQAYVKLYDAGLINQHLLPMRETDLVEDVEQRPGMIKVREQLNPWTLVAQAWSSGAELSRRRLTLTKDDGSCSLPFEISLPVPVPYMEDFILYWDAISSWKVSMDSDIVMDLPDGASNRQADDHTFALLSMAFGHRWPIPDKQYPIRFVSLSENISPDGVAANQFNHASAPNYLVRGTTAFTYNHPHVFVKYLPVKPPAEMVRKYFAGFEEAPHDTQWVVVRSFPKRAGYFRRPLRCHLPSSFPAKYPRVLRLDEVKMDNIPLVFGYAALLIPAMTMALESHLVATHLAQSRLKDIGITDVSMIIRAITATGAGRHVDYERVEFLGDAILKFCTTINCTAKYLYYPEGYLSASKDKIVSNSRLCRAAIDFGLDKYIINKPATQSHWRPIYVEDLIANPPNPHADRLMSTKTLADVVEALIGTAFISGGLPKALSCMSLFITGFEWQDIDVGRQTLYDQAPDDEVLPHTMRQLESLIGYTFTKKALLVEAMTHPSYNALEPRASLDRLEFVGDAILDFLVVRALYEVHDANGKPLENGALHLLRTALVNADILGFLAMEWAITQGRVEAEVFSASKGKREPPQVELVQTEVRLPLWNFMRHSSADMGAHQQATSVRHAAMREELRQALWEGGRYPWCGFARLQVQKFYSDVIESLLGAVWVDSGSLEECEGVLERMGLMGLMRRFVGGEGVHLMHPKEEIGVLGGNQRARYEVEKEGEGYRCRVWLGEKEGDKDKGECIADVKGCGSKEEARLKGAEEGCRVLRERIRQKKEEMEGKELEEGEIREEEEVDVDVN